MKICFSGSTKRSEKDKISKILQQYNPEVDIIVHGASPKGGIDNEVDMIAKEMGFTVKKFPPEKPIGKYFLGRNIKMANYSDILYAFPKLNITGEKAIKGIVTRGGTEHTIRQFVKRNKPVYVYLPDGKEIKKESS